MPRGVTLAFVALGGACVVFAALALGGRHTAAPTHVDPLGDLVAQRGKPGGAAASPGAVPKPTDLAPRDVTFPGILSDGEHPTTALAALRGASGSSGVTATAATASVPLVAVGSPPPPTDRLPVMPVPAQQVLEASPVVTRPRDALTRAASESAQITSPGAPSAAAGHEGGYQLQVSSFRTKEESDAFADQLRARGHKAYVVEAHVQGRGTWYRVRVGPFATQHLAAAYRSTFEEKEHVVPFIVQPTTASSASVPPATGSRRAAKPD